MLVLAGGQAQKYWPSLLNLLDKTGWQTERFSEIDVESIVEEDIAPKNKKKKPQQKAHQKDKTTSLFYSESDQPWSEFEAILSQTPNARAIVFYLPPEIVLADAMAASLSPEEAVFTWRMMIESVLSFHRNNRASIYVVNAEAALKFPNAFSEFCVNKFRFNGGDEIEYIQLPEPVPAFYSLLARELIEQNPDIENLQRQLRASSMPMGTEGAFPSLDVNQLKTEYSEMRDRVSTAEKESKQLRALVDEQLLEIKNTTMVMRDLEKKIAVFSDQAADSQNHAEHFFMELNSKRLELRELQNKLIWREAKKAREFAVFKQDIASHVEAVEAMKTSTSWRITAPLRKVGNKLKKKPRSRSELKEEIKIVRKSALFDGDWYRETYADVAAKGMEPAVHYVKFGAAEGRSPGPNFDARKYMSENPDVNINGKNPLIHYLEKNAALQSENLSESNKSS